MTSLTRNPKPKLFFSLQTRRPPQFFEGLNSSLVQSTWGAMRLVRQPKYAWF